MTYKTILFDLDGTILDTNELILRSLLHTFDMHLPQHNVTREELIPLMGRPLHDMLAHFDDQQVEQMKETYVAYNLEQHDALIREFPYVQEVVRTLYERDFQLGVVTTKRRQTALKGLRLFQLRQYMQTLVCLEDVTNPKPHPEPVQIALQALKADRQRTLMIGDSPFDIQAAQAAGVDAAGVSWTLKGPAVLEKLQPTYMLTDMRQLLSIVEGR